MADAAANMLNSADLRKLSTFGRSYAKGKRPGQDVRTRRSWALSLAVSAELPDLGVMKLLICLLHCLCLHRGQGLA